MPPKIQERQISSSCNLSDLAARLSDRGIRLLDPEVSLVWTSPDRHLHSRLVFGEGNFSTIVISIRLGL